MKIPNQNLYVLHIRDAVKQIKEYTYEKTYIDLESKPMLRDAVIRQVMIIGEASKNTPEKLKTEYANIPWKKISGSRDKMTHDYADIELDIIWHIVTKDLPELEKAISGYIETHKDEIAELERGVNE
ncbi:hypothetical protein A3A03_03125 [Candidatus Nomurabacteria bacterium RIFCSPLOWO2_01_FULL_40_18]|uniref:DUF86 domain-containing protein n=1 Tax=Candidatus Nomurabacteria bacterium RIFCSPLOWO2_01_FULL_40_18 TaxID=1801773 RepID=A0A1F6XJM1_9BACT|nr:MAG: hypothetical protein A3A03_03125 [Candidatus Nomurabacteria bacterium RIFCSPLOWO2_01_FULL_40_18]